LYTKVWSKYAQTKSVTVQALGLHKPPPRLLWCDNEQCCHLVKAVE